MAPTLRVPEITKKTKGHKYKFTEFEDKMILSLVGDNQETANWEIISCKLGNRTPRQCKDRYNMYLAPGLNKTQWTVEEDNLLLMLVANLGKKWKSIATSFNHRPEISLKNRYKLLQRRMKAFQPPQNFYLPAQPSPSVPKAEAAPEIPSVPQTSTKQEDLSFNFNFENFPGDNLFDLDFPFDDF